MTEAKHTPGPWSLFEVGDRPVRLCPGKKDDSGQGGESLLTIVEEEGVAFAAVLRDEDARLIAAAPELLEALDWLVQILPDPELDNDELQRTWTKKARAAIAKATGSQP